MTPETRTLVETLLAKYDAADVPGRVRTISGVIVTYAEATAIYDEIAVSQLGRKKLRSGGGRDYTPRPADFEQHAGAEINPLLMARYGCHVSLISRWRRETGIASPRENVPPPVKRVPVPNDFAARAPTMSLTQLCDHYGRSKFVVARWRHETGISSKQSRRGRLNAYLTAPVDRPTRDLSDAGRAADYLRRYGPVIRCDKRGLYRADGQFWLRGSTILDADDVIERARRLGWEAERYAA